MSTSDPSAVRARILEEHAVLRNLLDTLLANPTVAEMARFFDLLEAHLGFEEELLEPILATVDASGAERVRRLHEEHAAQRRELKWMRARLHEPIGAELRPWLRHFTHRLLCDMEAEERERLSPELLKDNAVSVEIDS